jgi:hypothetical protein
MSDPSLSVAATGIAAVFAVRELPFDDGLAETQPIELPDVNPIREENLT